MSEHNTTSRCAIGVDLGKKRSKVCVMENGVVTREFEVTGTKTAFQRAFGSLPRHRVILEVGAMSPWVSRTLSEMDFRVIVVAATTLKDCFSKGRRKNDRDDARGLAQIAVSCPEMLRVVEHRSEHAQRDLARLHVRATLVEERTRLINTVRGMLGSLGVQLPTCSTAAFVKRVHSTLAKGGEDATLVEPLLRQIEGATKSIRDLEKEIEALAQERYPAIKTLTQVHGVGTQTALTFMLTVTDPKRFRKNRTIGSYLGLVPAQYQSGDSNPQLRITKAGNTELRCLLVQCSQFILGRFGKESDLRRFGLAMAARGGPRSKKRAVVAVARRLAVLLLSLWRTGEIYEPLRNERLRGATLSA